MKHFLLAMTLMLGLSSTYASRVDTLNARNLPVAVIHKDGTVGFNHQRTLGDSYSTVQNLVYFSGCNGCQAGIDRGNDFLHANGLPSYMDIYDYWNLYADDGIDRDEELKNLWMFMQ